MGCKTLNVPPLGEGGHLSHQHVEKAVKCLSQLSLRLAFVQTSRNTAEQKQNCGLKSTG